MHARFQCGVQVAGAKSQTGLDVVDKAQSAVNLVKVINALNQISDMLKARLLQQPLATGCC